MERQAYYGGCIIDNQCHKLLEDDVSKKLCDPIPIIVAENTNNQEVYNEAVEQCEKFKILFGKYGKCHRVFNSARHLQLDEIYALDENIKSFLMYLCMNWPEIKISPKLHMVEDRMIPFLMKWRVGCGFYGEQGGESIHKMFNTMKRNYSNVKKDTDRLKYIMNCHLASTNPNARVTRVEKKSRNLKRNLEVS